MFQALGACPPPPVRSLPRLGRWLLLIIYWLHCVFTALLGFSLAVVSEGYSPVAVRVLLVAVACLAAEPKLESGLQ